MNEWRKYPVTFPNETGKYLCFVEIPSDGGSSSFKTYILGWYQFKGHWDCSGMIVRYWMPLPDEPVRG